MKTIDDIFIVRNGLTTTGLEIFRVPEDGRIRFLRPANTQPRTIAGWIDKAALSEGDIFPSDSLYVSTNGEGSHSYSYVSSFEFACNSDVSVLIPKEPMTIQEKLFYAQCITLNRFRFSYGRKPKGSRLKSIHLPPFPQKWNRELPLLRWA
jgi:hypothetical protein